MEKQLKVGQVVLFTYNNQQRQVKVEKVLDNRFVGFDFLADFPAGGYRSFSFDKVKDLYPV